MHKHVPRNTTARHPRSTHPASLAEASKVKISKRALHNGRQLLSSSTATMGRLVSCEESPAELGKFVTGANTSHSLTQTAKFFQYDREKTAQYLLDKTPRQLKAMCKSRQLPRKGTKKVLVEVLVNFIIDRKRPPGNIPKPKAGKRKRSGASSSQARKATTSNGKKVWQSPAAM